MLRSMIVFAVLLGAAIVSNAENVPAKASVGLNKDGIPHMLLNGTVTPLIIYREHRPWEHTKVTRAFADAGIPITTLAFTPVARERNYKVLDGQVAGTIAASPDAKIMIIVNTAVNNRTHKKWLEQHPDQISLWPGFSDPDGSLDKFITGDRASMASNLWLNAAAEDIHALVEYVRKSPYSDRVIGYFLTGTSGEWTDWYDYSRPAQEKFREWLKKKYKNDENLRKAWNDKSVTLELAEIPKWSTLFKGDCGIFFDPRKSSRQLDFLEYHHSLPASVIERFAKEIKDASNGESLVGLFYGYVTISGPCNDGAKPYMYAEFRMRHKSTASLLESPYIDILGSPYDYRERHAGGVFVPQQPVDSIILHGKMPLAEEDTRTHLTNTHKSYVSCEKNGDNFGKAADETETLSILKRNFGGIFSKPGSGLWYFGLGDSGDAWWNSSKITETISVMTKMAKEKLVDQDKNASEIAVIASFRSPEHMCFNGFMSEFIAPQITENLSRLGAPFDLYLDTDLFHPGFPFEKYKMFIFLNTFYFSDAERFALSKKLHAGGKTVLWTYAPGFVTDNALSTEALSELTGIKFEMKTLGLPGLHCVVTDYESPFTKGAASNLRFGSDDPYEKMNPMFFPADPEAKKLGDMLSYTTVEGVLSFRKPGLCVKQFPEWTSIWSAVPNLPSSLLRSMARGAGVHIYDDMDDQVFASRKLLTVHSRYAGERIIKLPGKCKVTDPFTGKTVSDSATEFKVRLPEGGTFMGLLEY